LRKDANLEIENRIVVSYSSDDETVSAALKEWDEYIRSETLADSLSARENSGAAKAVQVGEGKVAISVEKV
jgi:isoleucyl-tRNA synthetase